MKKIVKIILVTLTVVVFIAFIGSILFYFPSYTTVNNLVKAANNGYEQNFEGSKLISKEDYKKIQVVETINNQDNYYINGGTFITIKSIGIGKIEYLCKADYKVIDSGTEYQYQKTYSIKLEFNNGWKVNVVNEN